MARRLRLHGSIPALVTPFRGTGLDLPAFAALIERQVARGSGGLVVAGTTDEAASLSEQEYLALLQCAVQVTRRRLPVIAGVTASATDRAAHLARLAARCDVDLLLCGMPPYVKPTQEGLFRHVRTVHDAVDLPILLYDVPARSGVALSDETVARLSELPRVIGIKDATGDLGRVARLRRLCGTDFLQLSGDDASAAPHRLAGGHGCVSVTANVTPALCAALQDHVEAGNLDALRQVAEALRPLHEAMFLQSNPIPVKYALQHLGLIDGALRLPLTPLDAGGIAVLAPLLESLWAAEERLARGPHSHGPSRAA